MFKNIFSENNSQLNMTNIGSKKTKFCNAQQKPGPYSAPSN